MTNETDDNLVSSPALPAKIEGMVDRAQLPQSYERAKAALAESLRVDECREWVNKAEALASYAKQARDETLLHYARRIKARAVRRVGELLLEFDARKGKNDTTFVLAPRSRTQAAAHAGLTER
jgi:hypothetical protein